MPNDGAGIREASPSSEARGSQGPPNGRIGFRARWIFGNRDAVFPGGAFGHSREVRRNGDRKAFGGAIRSVGMVQGFARELIWAGKPIRASSGSNRGCVWIGWAGIPVAARLRIRGDGWKGPGGEAIKARRLSG